MYLCISPAHICLRDNVYVELYAFCWAQTGNVTLLSSLDTDIMHIY